MVDRVLHELKRDVHYRRLAVLRYRHTQCLFGIGRGVHCHRHGRTPLLPRHLDFLGRALLDLGQRHRHCDENGGDRGHARPPAPTIRPHRRCEPLGQICNGAHRFRGLQPRFEFGPELHPLLRRGRKVAVHARLARCKHLVGQRHAFELLFMRGPLVGGQVTEFVRVVFPRQLVIPSADSGRRCIIRNTQDNIRIH